VCQAFLGNLKMYGKTIGNKPDKPYIFGKVITKP
jgi:hypothetical protein